MALYVRLVADGGMEGWIDLSFVGSSTVRRQDPHPTILIKSHTLSISSLSPCDSLADLQCSLKRIPEC